MKIVSIIPESFLDYEDHLSIVLFCYGCNIECSYCFSYNYITNSENIINRTAEQLIDENINPLIDGLVFLGGEPTIYPDSLKSIALYAKKNYNLDIKLFTNGTNPEIVCLGLEEGWLDHVSIDFKAVQDLIYLKGVNPYEKVVSLLERINSLKLNNQAEVRTTLHSSLNDEELDHIISVCKKFNIKHITQKEFELT